MNHHRITRGLIAALAAVVLTAACDFKKPEERVRERATLLLQAKVDGKWDQVYDLYDADYRKTIPREAFAKRPRNMSYKGFVIEGVEVLPSGTEAVVRVTETVSVQTFAFKSPVIPQRWIKADDGKWYQRVEASENPFGRMFPSQPAPAAPQPQPPPTPSETTPPATTPPAK